MVDHRTVIGYRTKINYSSLWRSSVLLLFSLYFQYSMWFSFNKAYDPYWKPTLFIKYFGMTTAALWFFANLWAVYEDVRTTVRVTLNEREIWLDYLLLFKRKRFSVDEFEYFFQTSDAKRNLRYLTLVPRMGKEIVLYEESMKDYDKFVQMLLSTLIPDHGWSEEASSK